MKKIQLLTVIAALLLLVTSCKNDGPSHLSIPKDAAFVFHINSGSLSSKLSWSELKAAAWFKEAYQKADDAYAQKLMDNPDSSGIDTGKDFAFFMQRRGKGGYLMFEGAIKNAAAFEALCKKISKTDKTAAAGDWKTLSAKDGGVVAWNDSRFAFISDMPMGGMNPTGNDMYGAAQLTADSLKLIVQEVMSLKGSKNLFNDERFASMVKESGDMHIWANSSSLYSDFAGMLAVTKMGSLLAESVSASSLTFEDGRISVKSKSYMGKEMQEVMDKWKSQKVEAAAINRIPSDNVIGVIAANVDPQSLLGFFKTIGFDGLINMMLAKQNITINEVVAATKGQFVVAFSDLTMQTQLATVPETEGTEPVTYSTQKPDFNVLFATNVNQKPSFESVLNALTANEPALPFSYKLNNDWFVAANKPETVEAFLSGKGSNKPFADKISGHPFGMYFDIQRLLKTNFTEDAAAKGMLAESAAIWQDMIATGGAVKDGAVTADFIINMVDKKTNSLKQLNRFFEKMYEASQKNKVVYQSQDSIDSLPADTTTTTTVTPE